MRYLDSSVLIAAMRSDNAHHEACARLVLSGEDLATSAHALMEAFSILTGGHSRPRVDAADAAQILEENLSKRFQIVSLSPREIFQMLKLCRSRGVRGGAIYDFQHLTAARKAGAEVLHTLDFGDFQSFARNGDPRIELPT
jgi:predicted nucleic acid-binding protein